ncbi:MAG: hypothetical protein IJX87_01960, partial [Clostridia bacterium]|nr:hypothetical protein [Clostridia bacterium]
QETQFLVRVQGRKPLQSKAPIKQALLALYCVAVTNVPLDHIFLSFVAGTCNRIVARPVIP